VPCYVFHHFCYHFEGAIFKIQHSTASVPVVIQGDNLKPYKGNKMASWFKEIVREKTPVELPDVVKFLETDLDQHDLCNELERKIENKGESPLQSDNRSDEKHSMAPNDPFIILLCSFSA
jgi:hypothetical protein